MDLKLQAAPILPGTARGPLLVLKAPLSFWGGVDPRTGRITDPTSGAAGRSVAGTVLVLPATRGSSSGSAVLLQLLHAGLAPAALVLGAVDAVLGLGILVAREMGWPTIPLLLLAPAEQDRLSDGATATVEAQGLVRVDQEAGARTTAVPAQWS